MERRALLNYAHGREGSWEAICVDLDIAVQGRSFEEVKSLLNDAIRSYVEDALNEAPADQHRLLSRRAPWWERGRLALNYLVRSTFNRRGPGDLQASFDISCPA